MTPWTMEPAANMNNTLPSAPPDGVYSEGEDGNWFEEITDDAFDASEMNRENDNRCSLFHTIGYRDGVIAGKEAASQEGFNAGFLQSVSDGHKWGYVRGITSAFASLPESLKDKVAQNTKVKSRLENLHESAQGISTNDALKIFYESTLSRSLVQQQQNSEDKPSDASLVVSDMDSDRDQLSKLSQDLQSILQENSEMKIHTEILQVAFEKD